MNTDVWAFQSTWYLSQRKTGPEVPKPLLQIWNRNYLQRLKNNTELLIPVNHTMFPRFPSVKRFSMALQAASFDCTKPLCVIGIVRSSFTSLAWSAAGMLKGIKPQVIAHVISLHYQKLLIFSIFALVEPVTNPQGMIIPISWQCIIQSIIHEDSWYRLLLKSL